MGRHYNSELPFPQRAGFQMSTITAMMDFALTYSSMKVYLFLGPRARGFHPSQGKRAFASNVSPEALNLFLGRFLAPSPEAWGFCFLWKHSVYRVGRVFACALPGWGARLLSCSQSFSWASSGRKPVEKCLRISANSSCPLVSGGPRNSRLSL